jgi:hypothetical protein
MHSFQSLCIKYSIQRIFVSLTSFFSLANVVVTFKYSHTRLQAAIDVKILRNLICWAFNVMHLYDVVRNDGVLLNRTLSLSFIGLLKMH